MRLSIPIAIMKWPDILSLRSFLRFLLMGYQAVLREGWGRYSWLWLTGFSSFLLYSKVNVTNVTSTCIMQTGSIAIMQSPLDSR